VTPELQHDALIAYLIQYVGLGAVFLFGLWLAWREGEVGLNTARRRRWLFVMVGGYVAYAFMHGLFQFVLAA